MVTITRSKKSPNASDILAGSDLMLTTYTTSPIQVSLPEDQIPVQHNIFKKILNRLFEKDGCCSVEDVKSRVFFQKTQVLGTMNMFRY